MQKADIISLLDRLEALKVIPDKAEDYVKSFKVLRDALIAAGSSQPAERLLKTLLKALLDCWNIKGTKFKSLHQHLMHID